MMKKQLPTPVLALLLAGSAIPVAAQEGDVRRELTTVTASELVWPTPRSLARYEDIRGDRLKGFVEELVAISHRSREAGNKLWGRIAGLPSGEEAQRWVADKFRAAGLEVRLEEFELEPQTIPQSWGISVEGAGRTLELSSASPFIYFGRYMPAAEAELELDAVWVGLGLPSDFVGKDVAGKAVFIYSVPTPSSLIQSADWMGSITRAQEAGAAAIVVVLAIPGNWSYVSHIRGLSQRSKLPVFTVGLDDGEAVEALNAESLAAGEALKARLHWKVETKEGLTATNVIGVLPGRTDENIVMIAHTDSYFEGANDNGAGTAALVGVAEYFAKRPRSERRRTMYFIATADHHGGDRGGAWVHENLQDVLANAAIVANAEHVAVTAPVWDRTWGTSDRPSLLPTNELAASWWGVHGSDLLAEIVRDSFAALGVPTHLEQGGSAGQLRPVQWDAPSFYLHNKGVYYHASGDTIDIVPAQGLETAAQAFAKIFDDINRHDLDELRPPWWRSSAGSE
ncbi:MAG TPA: M28 family peptidase [Gammaproteobacteria bacterium]